jgi:hypothetical protein
MSVGSPGFGVKVQAVVDDVEVRVGRDDEGAELTGGVGGPFWDLGDKRVGAEGFVHDGLGVLKLGVVIV